MIWPMESAVSLILTKLRPPALRLRVVPRARLLHRFTLEPGTDLALVCAPAGYGKTTFLVAWAAALRQVGTAVAWYALDESDNRLAVFGAYFVASLEQALGPNSGLEPVSQVLRASPEADLLALLPTVINAVCSIRREVVLVLDDYHLIRNSTIHQVVEFLISHRPENLHLAIGSRANPPLPLARLRARGGLIELRAADLRFTEQETTCFLRDAMQLDLPADLSTRLAEQVEGWAAGLQLAALSLSGREDKDARIASFTGGHRRLAEYLLDEVVNGLPEELQAFLLYSSILERMSGPVCDAVLTTGNSAALLAQLEQLNLFVIALEDEATAGAGPTWYRYHHLFRDFLQTWLERTQPGRSAALHRTAANWFAAHGSLREAAYHAFRCGDWSFAADFVEQHCFTLIIQSEISTIAEWCAAFPETVLRSRPRLCVFQALALAYRFQGRHRAWVEARLQQAQQALAGMENEDQAFEVGELSGVVQTFLAMIPDAAVNVQKPWDLAQSRLAAFPPGDAGRFPWLLIAGYADLARNQPEAAKQAFEESRLLALQSGLFFGFVEATFHLSSLAYSQGRLQDSLEICRKGQVEFAGQPAPLPALGCLEIAAGRVLLEQDHLEEAGELLRHGLERMGWGMNPFYLMTAYLAQFRLYAIQRRLEEALSCLERLDALWPDLQWLTRGCRAEALLYAQPNDPEALQGTRDWLLAYLGRVSGELPLPGLGPIGAAEAFYQANLIWARLQIYLGHPQMVQPYLEQMLQRNQGKGLLGREIELWLIQAQVFSRQGEEAAAFAALEKALAISQPGGYVRAFDQGPVLDDLIHRVLLKGMYPADLERILSAIRAARSWAVGPKTGAANGEEMLKTAPDGELVEPLSDRELEVLRLIAAGASNQAIAEQFVITVGTVKSHIHHILGKLNARSRTEAVAQARKLRLIARD